ncbi:MAG: sugar transferase [Mangrovicoccus sp.]|nr:sugar transferase [Mangrovicoccus sp.]
MISLTVHFPESSEIVEKVSKTDKPLPAYGRFNKRAFDLLFVLIIGLPVALVVLCIAAIVALDGHKPFYFQRRVGLNGTLFNMVKLRSMVVNADEELTAYLEKNAEAKKEWHTYQKLTNDPRITPIGKIIRKLSLDELPQFWNVFVGDMSVVGPRPMMPSQRQLYPGQAYFKMRPGVTGFWQISSRNDTTFAARAHFDRSYFNRMSLRTDFGVIMRTISVMAKGTGS